MSIVLMITGARGCGKTEVRQVFEAFGFVPVDTESTYLKYGALYPGKLVNEMPEVQDAIYGDAQSEVLSRASLSDVVYEATGTNSRWFKLKEAIEEHYRVVICKVVSAPTVAGSRMEKRGWRSNYPSSPRITRDISVKSRKIPCDFVIENKGSLDDLRNKASQIMEVISCERQDKIAG